MSEHNFKSYAQILKSSSIMGGTAGIIMILGMVKTKFAAILIGAAGIGLLANFTAIQGMVGIIAGIGISSSAVRDVAAAAAKDDQQAIGRTMLTIRRMCWLTGLLGATAMMALSPLLSQWTFGTREYTLEIALLGLVILFGNLSSGQTAFIQGMRRIGDIARLNIIGATAGAIVSIGFYFWLGLRGIVPALVLTAAVQLGVSWHYARHVPASQVEMTWLESFREAGGMIRLGIAMMWAGLMGSLVFYITNALITHRISLEAVGLYNAAFALSGMFVNFVLSAMGADYYPRLTGVAPNKEAMNRLANEQTEIGLLLAVPGLLATLCLAPWIIQIFYTKGFLQAADLLQWFILGCLVRVIQWPMGFLQLALGMSNWFLFTQTLLNGIHLALIWIGLTAFGIEGVSMAFSLLYVCSLGVIMLVARHLTGFSWSPATRRLLLVLLPLVAMVFVTARSLPFWPATIFGITATGVVTVISLRGLVKRVGYEHRLTQAVFRIPGVRMVCGGKCN